MQGNGKARKLRRPSRMDDPEDPPVFGFRGMHPALLILMLLYVVAVLLAASGDVATLDLSFVLLGPGFLKRVVRGPELRSPIPGQPDDGVWDLRGIPRDRIRMLLVLLAALPSSTGRRAPGRGMKRNGFFLSYPG
jgi:hypothetical protein